MNLFEIKYERLLKLVQQERGLEEKQRKYPNQDDRRRLYSTRYQIDQIIKSESLEKIIIQKRIEKEN